MKQIGAIQEMNKAKSLFLKITTTKGCNNSHPLLFFYLL